MNAEDASAREDRVDQAIASYLEAVEAGNAPPPDEFMARHPDQAAELKLFFADRERFKRFAGPAERLMPPPEVKDAEDPRKASHDPGRMDRTLAPGEQPASGPALGTVRYFGDYELVEEIARGGMGVVYRARQTSLKRMVAIKMILSGQLAGDEDVRRFRAEAEAAARLDHPGIVPIFEVGQHAGQHYFSMALVEGESLAHLVLKGVLPPRQAAEMARKVSQAISYAHIEGVIHRDLKPANVLIDKEGQPRVTDFGLAKRLPAEAERHSGGGAESQLTVSGQVIGTPSYMAPEQAAGKTKEIGARSDVYSLGAILYCLLTGRPPFQAASAVETLLQVIEQLPVPPQQLNAAVPRDLQTICLKCLQKEPRRRYGSAQELVDDLQRFLNGEPIHARPIHLAERSWRWLRKQRRSAVIASVAGLAAVIVAMASFAGWSSYEQSRLAYLQLKTGASEGSVLTAELLDALDEPAGPPFTVPTKEPVAATASSYRLRLSGSGSLSETFLLDLDAATEQSFTVGLRDSRLGEAIPVGAPDGFEAVDLDGGLDLIFLPRPDCAGQGRRMRRISAASGKTIWEVNWDTSDPMDVGLAGIIKTQADRQQWRRLGEAWQAGGKAPPVLLRTHEGDKGRDRSQALRRQGSFEPPLDEAPAFDSLPDLDGDGVRDLVWAFSSGAGEDQTNDNAAPPSLVAVSGKEGRVLWWFRARTSSGFARSGLAAAAPVLVRTATGAARLIALFGSRYGWWMEAISADEGKSIWRADLDPPSTSSEQLPEPFGPAFCSVGGKSVVVVVAGNRLSGFDPTTGEPAWPVRDLGWKPARAPLLVDLDGDGSDEALLLFSDPAQARFLIAVSLATGKPLWPSPAPVNYQADFTSGWPLVADLAGGRDPVVVVPVRTARSNGERTGVEVLQGLTGRILWEKRFPIDGLLIANSNRAPDRYAIGPDLDGDGCRELFVISTRADRMERSGDPRHPGLCSLYVDALSGKDGHTIWWSRIPLGDVLPTRWSGGIGRVIWGPPGPDGRPSLVVSVASTPEMASDPLSHDVFVLSASSGRVLHIGHELWQPFAADVDRDGITDLGAFLPDDPRTINGSLNNPAGKIVVFRGSPPEAWRRLGGWEPAADFDGDGFAELFKADASEPIIASGGDGRLVARWKVDWSAGGIVGFDPPDRYPLALPGGDLNGDGIADVLLCARHRYFDGDANRPFVDRPGRLFFPLQGISGKTGTRLWLAGDIPDPVSGDHAYLYAQCYSPHCEGVGGDGSPEVLCPFSCFSLGAGPFQRRLGVALVSGSDGTLRWTQTLEEERALGQPGGVIAHSEFMPPIAATAVDLNGDGVRDWVVTVASLPDHGVEIHALDGRDGRRLWRRALLRRWNKDAYPNLSPQPVCGDLDGDGRPEVVAVESGGMSGIWTRYKVMALDGLNGEVRWVWQCVNPSRGGDPMEDNDWPLVLLADLDGKGHPSVCVGVHDRGANEKSAIVVLDHRGGVRARLEGAICFRAADLDGGGREELLYAEGGKVRAMRGLDGRTLWEWPLPGGAGGILDVRPGGRGQPATVILEAAGASRIDDWGRSFLESFPPRQGVGLRGDSIYGLDGATGKPLWRGRRDPSGQARLPALSRLPPHERSPVLVTRSGDRTVARLILPTDDRGGYLLPAPIPPVTHLSPLTDPRLLRRLPGLPPLAMTGLPLAIELLQPPAVLALCSLLVLVLPGWVLARGVVQRPWTWRGLLLVLIALAIALAGYQLVLQLPLHGFPGHGRFPRLIATPLGLPALTFPALLVVWTIRRRWARLGWLLAASLLLSSLVAALAIWIDSRGMDPSERYSWDGWWFFLIIGSYLAAALTMAGMVIASSVRAFRGTHRRSTSAA